MTQIETPKVRTITGNLQTGQYMWPHKLTDKGQTNFLEIADKNGSYGNRKCSSVAFDGKLRKSRWDEC